MGTSAIHQKKFGDVLYSFRMLPASEAMEVWAALEPFVANPGNSLSAVAAVGGKEVASIIAKGEAAADRESLMATVAMLTALSGLPGDDWSAPSGGKMIGRKRIVAALFGATTIGGTAIEPDVHFAGAGKLKVMYQVLGESMRINFADFFSGLAEVTDSLLAAAKPA